MNTGVNACINSTCPERERRAFTLIELLVAMSILAILASMLSVMVAVAQRQGKLTNTRAIMMKVDQAIRQFRTDMRVYPWQTDLGIAPTEPTDWSNNLAYRLAWTPPATGSGTGANPDRLTYMRAFQDDVIAIQRRFRFVNGCNVPPSGDSSEGTHAFRNEVQTPTSHTNLLVGVGSLRTTVAAINGAADRYIPGTASSGNDCCGDAQVLTKMAEEVTLFAYIAGQLPTLAPTGIDATLAADKAKFPNEDERFPSMLTAAAGKPPFRYFPYNKTGYYGNDSRGPALTSAAAKAHGWRGDYLANAIRTEAAAGNRLDVDATGNAIIDAWGRPLIYVCTVRPGVRGYMPALTTSIFSGTQEQRYNMGPQGRDVTDVLASDIRTTAAAAYTFEFELWSSGPDGSFAASRDAAVNRDNISLLPYAKGLK